MAKNTGIKPLHQGGRALAKMGAKPGSTHRSGGKKGSWYESHGKKFNDAGKRGAWLEGEMDPILAEMTEKTKK